MSTPGTYDGSTQTPQRYDPLAGLDRPDPDLEQPYTPVAQDFTPPGAGHPGANNGGSDVSALAMLRERVDQREQKPVELWTKVIAGVGVRITCDPRIPNTEFQRWVRASRPKTNSRRPGGGDGMDMDQLGMSARAIAHTNVSVELDKRFGKGGDPQWEPITDRDGETLTVEHQEMWRMFGVISSQLLLVKLFGRDPDVIDAGQELLDAAGYLGGGDDDDPS